MSQSEQPQPLNETLSLDAAPPNRDLTGMTLGDFFVERMLGHGGMGEVYLARQVSLNRQVAIKVLRPDFLTRENYIKRFEAEATAVARLNHPNIVHVYTLGHIDQFRFIAMEYVQGTNLRDYLVKKGALDLAVALSIMKQAGVAIGAAGEIGLVHRDIKPENILLTRKGQAKIADFGLCRDQDADQHHLTQPGVTMGTPLYMSPEQAQGYPADHRSDLYSLGVTFYHMLAGAPPFRADTALALALKHVKDTPVSLSVHRPDLPAELEALVMKLIAKKPEDRYQSAAEMLRDLSKIKGSLNGPTTAVNVSMTDAVSVSGSTNGSPAAGPSMSQTAQAAVGRLTALQLGGKQLSALVALFLVAGALTGWLTRSQDLLAAGSAEPDVPGLWMAPGWRSIKQQPNPESQFRYAQLAASRDETEAAWLAVPAYYPRSHEWIAQAYIQLARTLLRRQDAERLTVFGAEIDRWNESKTHEKELADIIQAGVKALNGDPDGVINDFRTRVRLNELTDPALVELGIEVTVQAMDAASQPGMPSRSLDPLRAIRRDLTTKLFQFRAGGAQARFGARAN